MPMIVEDFETIAKEYRRLFGDALDIPEPDHKAIELIEFTEEDIRNLSAA